VKDFLFSNIVVEVKFKLTNSELPHLSPQTSNMKLRTALPSGLTNKMCERFDPSRMGGMPPIRFVPSSTETKKDEEESDDQVKITINSDVQKYYPIFKTGDAEAVINLIRMHEGIISDKKLKERFDIVTKLAEPKKTKVKKLASQPSRTKDEKEEVQELELALREYNSQQKQIQEEAFDFFEKLLDISLVLTWRDILKQECDSADYIDHLGIQITSAPRGRTFEALVPCYYKMVLLVATQDAAERMKRYLQTTVKLGDTVRIVQLFSRMKDLNDMMKYLPCLKHIEGLPANLPTMNVPFSELDMCTNIIGALPVPMSTAYYASKGQHFPVCMKKLEEDLILIEASVQRQHKMMNDLRARAGLPTSGLRSEGKEKPNKIKSGSDPIPKKEKKSGGKY